MIRLHRIEIEVLSRIDPRIRVSMVAWFYGTFKGTHVGEARNFFHTNQQTHTRLNGENGAHR